MTKWGGLCRGLALVNHPARLKLIFLTVPGSAFTIRTATVESRLRETR